MKLDGYIRVSRINGRSGESFISPDVQRDTIASYALRQAAFSRDICVEAVANAMAGRLETINPNLPSKQWYHPTIWFYLWTGLTKRVW